MNIRKYFMIAAAVLSIAAISSCKKEGLPFFRGTYGYVTSGSLICQCTDEDASELPIECQIVPERGIMRIDGDSKGTILTMCSISGEAMVFNVTIDGTDVTLDSQSRMAALTVESRAVVIPVTVSGSGHKTDGIIVLDLKYEGGEFTTTDVNDTHTYKLVGSNVRCIASVQE